MSSRLISLSAWLFVTATLVAASPAAPVDVSKLPPPVERTVSFLDDVDPILEKRCYMCHGDDVEMNGYSLWRKKEAVQGGYSGRAAIVVGNSEQSRLIHLVAGLEEHLVMPVAGVRLTPEEIGILRAWIDQGAGWAAGRDDVQKRSEPHWLNMDYGPVISASITVREPEDPRADKGPDDNISYKAHAIALNEEKSASVLFDTELLRYAAGWTGDHLVLTGTVFDWKHGPHPYVAGKTMFENPVAPGWARDSSFRDPREEGFGPLPENWAKYKGRYVHGDLTILSYSVGDAKVLDLPGSLNSNGIEVITRTLEVAASSQELLLQVAWLKGGHAEQLSLETLRPAGGATGRRLARLTGDSTIVTGVAGCDGNTSWALDDAEHIRLRIPASAATQRLTIYQARLLGDQLGAFAELIREASAPEPLQNYTQGGPARFPETIVTEGKLGQGSGPYVLDELTLPFENPWKSWMRPGDIAFFSGDRAAMSTWSGDVWVVSGVDDDLAELKWKRYATGFNQPLGLEVVDDVVHVLDRNQITRLIDLNGDGEPDFYENFNNDFHVTHHFHEFTFDLDRDPQGNFIFAKAARHALDAKVKHHGTIMKLDPKGKNLEIVCTGFRVPNGVAVGPNSEITTSDQEGHWIPSTRINWCSPGSFHGYMYGGSIPDRDDYDKPITFLPINFDNSGAGQAWVDNDRWGPFKGHLVHTSFGRGKVYLVLMEEVDGQIQGGAVEFPVLAGAGLMRPDFRKQDGQLYLTGLWGWGTKRPDVGGFYRMRYTGRPVHMPTELHVTEQGVAITFSDPLDPGSAGDLSNYSSRRWNYKWLSRYGSDLFKLNGEQGTDEVKITSATLSSDGKTVLLKMEDLVEVMQMQVNFKLKAADGTPIEKVLYHTINKLSAKKGKAVTVQY